MRDKFQYLGLLLGVLYGLIIRVINDNDRFHDFYSIYSITFIWITPVVIGLVPILFSANEIYKSKVKLFFYPFLTVVLFLIAALITRIEDLICLLIIGLPFLLASGILGVLLGLFVRKRLRSKNLYSILLIPLLLNPLENLLPNKIKRYKVSSEIIILNSPENIFPNLLNVPLIADEEYNNGFFQIIGIPRPMYSTTFIEDDKLYRIGQFTDNLKLYEYVSEIRNNNFVNFKIDWSKSQLRDIPTDQHLLKSEYFDFENINYTLIKISPNQTKVILSCDYKIESKMNFYANFWAKSIIQDFEKRLLESLKLKLEQ